ncbi:MAG: hypothetical protein MJZ08_00880 [Bacteroidaceae bacterium]|nr:hypothetical protein [Bacteroidaceae bacterium]
MSYRTLYDIKLKKEAINRELMTNKSEISEVWHELFHSKRPSNRGEMLAQIAGNAFTIYDGFMLVRRLMGRRNKRISKWFF